jgi:glucosamine--fructose-6-phosphate aminotransferase (isomerizing)
MSRLEQEIAEAPLAVARVWDRNRAVWPELMRRFREARPPALFTLARGSSDAAAQFAAYRLASGLGLMTGSLPPSLAGIARAPLAARGLWILAISQSGQSADLVEALGRLVGAGGLGLSLALVNQTHSPLARSAERILDQAAGPERSVAATKSFQASLAGVDALACALAGEDGEARLQQLADLLAAPPIRSSGLEALVSARSALVLARGASLAAAQEVALKLKEAAGLHAEAVSAAEVMHGPKALAAGGVPVLALIGRGPLGATTAEAARHLERLGAPLARLEIEPSGSTETPLDHDPALLVQGFYRRLPELARARGHDPDAPPHLSKVTSTR